MKIFVTGSTGFIGSCFINYALKNGVTIQALKREENSKCRRVLDIEPSWTIRSDFSKIQTSDFKGVDLLLHLGCHSANAPYDDLYTCMKNNVLSPIVMLNKAYEAGVRNFITTGTCFEYGKSGEKFEYIPPNATLEPTMTYPASKAAASIVFSQWAREKKVNFKILRLFQIYGEGEIESRLWPSLVRSARANIDLELTKGEQIRDFLNVEDLAEKLLNECKKQISNAVPMLEIKNVGSGNGMSIRKFVETEWAKQNTKAKLIFGAKPYREGEILSYLPDLRTTIKEIL